MRYKVEFEFINNYGEWKKTDMSFNGTMTHEEALYLRNDLARREGHRNVKIVEY